MSDDLLRMHEPQPTGDALEDMRTLIGLMDEVMDEEDWETTLESDEEPRAKLMRFRDKIDTRPGVSDVAVGIWDRRDAADTEQAKAMLVELAKTEPGWAFEGDEGDGVFQVRVSDAFFAELKGSGAAERTVGEFHLEGEWPS